ncbi:MAG: DUF1840 domain-containing protein [Alishewanella sp.]|nr:DUF1840 domain-containing protein [Alishewanella sp.]
MITFTTPSWSALSYLQQSGEQMLQMMNCNMQTYMADSAQTIKKSTGIIPAEDVATAIALLQQRSRLADEVQQQQDDMQHELAELPAELQEEPLPSASTRAFPLLELLQAAHNAQEPVIWQHST